MAAADQRLRLKKFAPTFQPEYSVEKIKFGVLSSQEIEKLSITEIINSGLYDETTSECLSYGPLDSHLGTSIRSALCLTCNKSSLDCIGHFGYINLCLPCYHIGFIKDTIDILKCICKTCSNILLPNTKNNNIPNTYQYFKTRMMYVILSYIYIISVCLVFFLHIFFELFDF